MRPRPAGNRPARSTWWPQRLEARGNPVVVTAPSQKDKGGVVIARASGSSTTCSTKSIALDGGQEVFLQQGAERNPRPQPLLPVGRRRAGWAGSSAQGPGWLRGQPADRPDQQLEAVWHDKLRVEPQGDSQLISMINGAETESPGVAVLTFPGVGELSAPRSSSGSRKRRRGPMPNRIRVPRRCLPVQSCRRMKRPTETPLPDRGPSGCLLRTTCA